MFLMKVLHVNSAGDRDYKLISVFTDNWVRELGLWCPSLKVLVYYGELIMFKSAVCFSR